jgi:signal transduction histidine kinase
LSKIRNLNALEKKHGDLFSLMHGIRAGQRELISLISNGKILNLIVRASEFTLEKDIYKIVSLQDIKPELDEQEVDSWQKLVRVLIHEITNSTIPITNMISVAREFLVKPDGKPKKIPGLNKEEINDLVESLAIAESRSKGLVNFVQTTKSLTQIQEPLFMVINVKDIFARLKDLFKKELELSNIEMKSTIIGRDLELQADLSLLEQVLINVTRNSIDSFTGITNPYIELIADYNAAGRPIIMIRDNGIGIDKENLGQIFVPFYTTKKNGSGIGLSLSRQIMMLHKGRIEVESEKGKGTCITLEF